MIARLVRRLVHGLRSRHEEAALREELEFHHAMKQQELERGGMTPDEARVAASRRIGNATRAREDARAVWIWPWLDGLRQDTSYAARSLRRQPGFTLMSLAVLGVAIGLNVSLFTVFAGLAIRPMAGIRDAASVVTVAALNPPRLGGVSGLSFPEYAYLADQSTSFAGLTAAVPMTVRLEADGSPRTMTAYLATANYFDVLGVPMELGRGFLPGEDRLGSPQPVAVLSDALWRARFAGDPAVIGREVRIEGLPFTVIGIASRLFVGPAGSSSRIWLPISAAPVIRPNDPFVSTLLERADSCCVTVTGRRAPLVSNAQAQAEAQVLSRRFRDSVQQPDRPIVLNGTQFLAGRSAAGKALAILGVLSLGMLLVLLIACANVGNLMLARAAARVGEIGVRISLGAGRARIVRQLLTEGFVLAIAASVVGALVAVWLPAVALQMLAGEARPFDIDLDRWVFTYTFSLAVLSCVAFALAPALHATRCDITSALRHDTTALRSGFPLRSALLAVQVAVSVVLLTSAGLLLRGVVQARVLDPGFRVDDVSVATIDLAESRYGPARMRAFVTELTTGLRESHVAAFGLVSLEPLADARDSMGMRLPGERVEDTRSVGVLNVSPGYFDTLGIQLVAGRSFSDDDETRRVAIINETMARRYWPARTPLGQSIIAGPGAGSFEIVGIARDAHLVTMDTIEPLVLLPLADRQPRVLFTTTDTTAVSKVAAVVGRIDARARVDITPLRNRLDGWLGEITLAPIAASVLGVFGLVVAVVGMIGVFSYAVRQRTREIGIRVALGASGRDVIRLVLASSSRAVLVGLGAGAVGAIAASQILRRALYGLSPFDPIAYSGVVVLLAAAAIAASYVPARRALKIDPVTALRYD